MVVHPVLFQIFKFKLHTYGALMGIGFLTAMQLIFRRGRRIHVSENHLNTFVLLAFVFGIIGARSLYIIIDHPMTYLRHPLEIPSQ